MYFCHQVKGWEGIFCSFSNQDQVILTQLKRCCLLFQLRQGIDAVPEVLYSCLFERCWRNQRNLSILSLLIFFLCFLKDFFLQQEKCVVIIKKIVSGLKNNVILGNKEYLVGLSVCLPSHISVTKCLHEQSFQEFMCAL